MMFPIGLPATLIAPPATTDSLPMKAVLEIFSIPADAIAPPM